MRGVVSFFLLCPFAMIALASCGQRPLEPRDPTPGVPHFHVATFNMRDIASHDPETVDAVGNTGAEIVALQEVTDEWEPILRARYSARYPNMIFHADGSAGIGFLSVYPLREYKLISAPNGWHPASHIHVKTPAGWLGVLNVHLHSPEVGGTDSIGALQAVPKQHVDEINLFREESSHAPDPCFHGGPVLVLGDFNEGDDGAAVSYLEDLGFQNVLPLYHPGQFTWRHKSVGGQFNQALDHILFDGSMQSLNAYVGDGGTSDHLPVIAHFEASYPWPQTE